MRLFRLKYWDSEHPFELYWINIDAIIYIHTYQAANLDDDWEYNLVIGIAANVKVYHYIHQLNRDSDMGNIIKECNASANSSYKPDLLMYDKILERML